MIKNFENHFITTINSAVTYCQTTVEVSWTLGIEIIKKCQKLKNFNIASFIKKIIAKIRNKNLQNHLFATRNCSVT